MPSPREWEVAAESYWKCQGHDTRRAIRAKFFAVDFWHCDILGRKGHERVFCQVTCAKDSGTLAAKRRKLERDDWAPNERVCIFQGVRTEDPVDKSREVYWFRVHWYTPETAEWTVDPEAIRIPREWFRVHR